MFSLFRRVPYADSPEGSHNAQSTLQDSLVIFVHRQDKLIRFVIREWGNQTFPWGSLGVGTLRQRYKLGETKVLNQ